MIRRTITLEEIMRTFATSTYLTLSGLLTVIEERYLPSDTRSLPDDLKTQLKDVLKRFLPDCVALGMRASVATMLKIEMMIDTDNPTLTQFRELAVELHGRMIDEMMSIRFLAIEPDKLDFVANNNLFGDQTANSFPSAMVDIEEAGRCLAFERWTAAVFHLSRVAEIATVTICKRVGYASPKEGFGEALKFMDSNLDKLRSDYEHANPSFKGDREFLSKVATQMHAVNDAWRGRVAHMDSKYTEEEAIRIWETTKFLMQELASKLSEEADA